MKEMLTGIPKFIGKVEFQCRRSEDSKEVILTGLLTKTVSVEFKPGETSNEVIIKMMVDIARLLNENT